MRIGVPKETADGERRVALVPDVVRRLSGAGHEVVIEAGAGAGAGVPDGDFTEAGASVGDPWGADVIARVAPGPPGQLTQRARADRLPRPAQRRRERVGDRAHRRHGLRDGGDPAHLARAVDGRAVLAGDGRGLPGGADRRPGDAALPADADDGRGHDPARPGARAGRRGRRAAGDRHRAAPRRGGHRLRRALGGQGADRVAGSEVLRGRRAGRRRGLRRLRPRADARGAGDAAQGAHRADGRAPT